MTKPKLEIPLEQRIWVDLPTAAALLGYSENKFKEIREEPSFVTAGVERIDGRFSQDLLRRWGNGEIGR
ncbi:hypothetical protein [Weissella paramesenteroides]|uniref:hypothetical protein n=1 Tax=Weissella paramesenteroides TaxID=1249 RepID=UPI00123C1098|nr:hypothetical protein [Weissella paramesenteroides]KAA8455273.1 hypothetical protein FKV86_08220 [Weissella paramesenteroides]KAA8456266.1 hypothetical protein FKV78_08305 [Weissella paramesenteroides]KAA8458243.1 hypothetical protein FKV82_07380 [Weissella paramesenteroides]KAA8460234.1 hypothetical protein FKV80_09110 [Weissella paramesenteroides]KAA8461576.1 hypothetical protein FKV85_08090 [Weissella paramesenteroides]